MRGKQAGGKQSVYAHGLIPAHAGKTEKLNSSAGTNRAHPRACGENFTEDTSYLEILGSSPRMRGKLSAAAKPPSPPGLIPAHAGKTAAAWFRNSGQPAHPRACGENLRASLRTTQDLGSSPRMRGKPPLTRERPREAGLIPAHAGKTIDRWNNWKRARAHPRACGENNRPRRLWTRLMGSSPRMRGKLLGACGVINENGLIPAHAGKTSAPI